MPKRQKVLETTPDAAGVPEHKKKKAADKTAPVAKTPAATHKRSTSKTKNTVTNPTPSSGKRTIEEAALRVALPAENGQAAANSPIPAPTREQIALRAYYHFVARGWQHGFDVEDWCRAERELLELA